MLEPFRDHDIFIISCFSTVKICSDFRFEIKKGFCSFVRYFIGFVDPYSFADPDPGSQNLADLKQYRINNTEVCTVHYAPFFGKVSKL